MVHLTFHGGSGVPALRLRVTDFRVTGGVLWDHLEYGMIASYCDGCWKHRRRHYSTVSVSGPCCLVFGTTRDPSLRSELIGLLSFDGPILRARGIAIARYREEHEMWFGLKRPLFWSAMRVVGVEALSAMVDPSHIDSINMAFVDRRRSSSLPSLEPFPSQAAPPGRRPH